MDFVNTVMDYLGIKFDLNGALQLVGFATALISIGIPSWTTMREIEQDQAVGHRTSALFMAGLANFMLWALYPKANHLSQFLNAVGFAVMVYYLYKFLRYCEGEQFQWQLVLIIVGVVVSSVPLMFYIPARETYADFMRWICFLSRGLLGFAPFITWGVMRDLRVMPGVLLCFVALANAALGACIAYTGPKTEPDPFVLWASFAGAVAAALQIFVHVGLSLRRNGVAGTVAAAWQLIVLCLRRGNGELGQPLVDVEDQHLE